MSIDDIYDKIENLYNYELLESKIMYLIVSYFNDDLEKLTPHIKSILCFIKYSFPYKKLKEKDIIINSIKAYKLYFLDKKLPVDILLELQSIEESYSNSELLELLHSIYQYAREELENIYEKTFEYFQIPTNNILTGIPLQDKIIECWKEKGETIMNRYFMFNGNDSCVKLEDKMNEIVNAITLIENSDDKHVIEIVENVKNKYSSNDKVRTKERPYINAI